MEELEINGIVVSPSVVETIVDMAAKSVDGIVSLYPVAQSGFRSLLSSDNSAPKVEIEVDEQGLRLGVHVEVRYGYVLPELADKLRDATAEAISTQMGLRVTNVDIYVDSISFEQ